MKSPSLKQIIDSNRAGLGTVEGNIVSAAKGRKIASIYVTSARPGEGKSITAASLAYGLSITVNEPVLLIEGSTTNPCFNKLFNFDTDKPGMIDYLLSKAPLDDTVQTTDFPNFMIIPSDFKASKNGQSELREAFNNDNFRKKMSEMQERFSHVVIDGDAVFASSVPSRQAPIFDGVVLTIEYGRTKWEVVNLARNKLTDAGAKILGVILNKREYAIPASLYTKV